MIQVLTACVSYRQALHLFCRQVSPLLMLFKTVCNLWRLMERWKKKKLPGDKKLHAMGICENKLQLLEADLQDLIRFTLWLISFFQPLGCQSVGLHSETCFRVANPSETWSLVSISISFFFLLFVVWCIEGSLWQPWRELTQSCCSLADYPAEALTFYSLTPKILTSLFPNPTWKRRLSLTILQGNPSARIERLQQPRFTGCVTL